MKEICLLPNLAKQMNLLFLFGEPLREAKALKLPHYGKYLKSIGWVLNKHPPLW